VSLKITACAEKIKNLPKKKFCLHFQAVTVRCMSHLKFSSYFFICMFQERRGWQIPHCQGKSRSKSPWSSNPHLLYFFLYLHCAHTHTQTQTHPLSLSPSLNTHQETFFVNNNFRFSNHRSGSRMFWLKQAKREGLLFSL